MTNPQSVSGPKPVKLRKLAQKKRYDELKSAWMVTIENEANSIQELARQKEIKQAESLFWFLLTARAERMGPEGGHR